MLKSKIEGKVGLLVEGEDSFIVSINVNCIRSYSMCCVNCIAYCRDIIYNAWI